MPLSFPHIAWVAFGSNLGDKASNCLEAIRQIHAHPKCEVLKVSSFYKTEPLKKEDDAPGEWYINGVLKIRTSLSPIAMLELLLSIERKEGRVRSDQKWEPRALDLDLLFFDKEIIKTKPLSVPHPELHKRRFVLEPLQEIDPDWVHPIFGKTVRALLRHLKDQKKVIPLFRFFLAQSGEGLLEKRGEPLGEEIFYPPTLDRKS